MKIYTKISLILLIPLFVGLSGCVKYDEYPIIPHIDYAGFATLRDITGKDSIGVITISYTDGDGNIGIFPWDTLPPLKYNYFLKFYQYIDGLPVEVLPVQDSSGVTFNARIPNLTPKGKNKNIKGDIANTLELYFARQILKSDIISFEIYIEDRDFNKSNVVTTPQFVIKK